MVMPLNNLAILLHDTGRLTEAEEVAGRALVVAVKPPLSSIPSRRTVRNPLKVNVTV